MQNAEHSSREKYRCSWNTLVWLVDPVDNFHFTAPKRHRKVQLWFNLAMCLSHWMQHWLATSGTLSINTRIMKKGERWRKLLPNKNFMFSSLYLFYIFFPLCISALIFFFCVPFPPSSSCRRSTIPYLDVLFPIMNFDPLLSHNLSYSHCPSFLIASSCLNPAPLYP